MQFYMNIIEAFGFLQHREQQHPSNLFNDIKSIFLLLASIDEDARNSVEISWTTTIYRLNDKFANS
ncbi:hypothetical protein KQX54_000121, partial [Cotesia glomerata]